MENLAIHFSLVYFPNRVLACSKFAWIYVIKHTTIQLLLIEVYQTLWYISMSLNTYQYCTKPGGSYAVTLY